MLDVKRVVVGRLRTNCYIVSSGDEVVIIDPGGDWRLIKSALGGRTPNLVILTHGHIDHFAALPTLIKLYGVGYAVHEADIPLIEAQREFSDEFGMEGYPPAPSRLLREGDVVAGLRVMHTPGHSPGSVSLLAGKAVFTGDTLFMDGVGRTDLPGGSREDMCRSLKKLFSLPDDTLVYPGHGPTTIIGRERGENVAAEILMGLC